MCIRFEVTIIPRQEEEQIEREKKDEGSFAFQSTNNVGKRFQTNKTFIDFYHIKKKKTTRLKSNLFNNSSCSVSVWQKFFF